MLIRIAMLAAIASLASCTQETGAATMRAAVAATTVPTGAVIGPEGYATITDAPPAPFVPAEPGAPQPLTPAQLAGHEEFRGAAIFQNEVMEEVQALADRLRAAEAGNFVDLYFENEGEPHVVFRFLRDAEATLARYNRHPRFKAATARFSNEELQAAFDFMFETFAEDRVIEAGGLGNKQNRARIEISVTEAEFRALVARKGVRIPEAVELVFRADQPAAMINRPLPPNIAPLVRIFPRSDRPLGALHSINSHARVVLDDGCFRVAGGALDGALVLFPLGAQLFVDREGFLAYGAREVPGYARVGEQLVFPGSIAEVGAPELAEPIRRACGPGKIVEITAMQSAAAERAQQAASQNADALRQLRDGYGLPDEAARRVLERCRQRNPHSVCLMSPPAPGPSACPPGSAPSFGLCRTPEGHIRPIPSWIKDLLRD